MRYSTSLLICLGSLLLIIALAALVPQVPFATGYPHPEIKGLLISKATSDDTALTRWLGYLFGVGILALFGTMIYIGNLRQGKTTRMHRFIIIGIIAVTFVYSGMVFEHWRYGKGENDFFLWMPKPTAWMIIGMWFVPLIITSVYYFRFEKYVLSKNEEDTCMKELATYHRND